MLMVLLARHARLENRPAQLKPDIHTQRVAIAVGLGLMAVLWIFASTMEAAG